MYHNPALADVPTHEADLIRFNKFKVNTAWIYKMRSLKNDEFKLELERKHRELLEKEEKSATELEDQNLDSAEAAEFKETTDRVIQEDFQELLKAFCSILEHKLSNFQREVQVLSTDFSLEMKALEDMQKDEINRITAILETVAAIESDKAKVTSHLDSEAIENMENASAVSLHDTRRELEAKINQLKDRCTAQVTNYKQTTERQSAEYRDLLAKDQANAQAVADKQKQVKKIQAEISELKLRGMIARRNWEARNSQLKEEKIAMQSNMEGLKSKMQKQQRAAQEKLVDLANNAESAKKTLRKKLGVVEDIYRTLQLCDTYLSEEERINPFPAEHEEFFGEENTGMGPFLRRVARIELDAKAVEMEREEAEAEHRRLLGDLRDLVKGSSVTKDAVDDRDNTLLIVKGVRK